MAVRRFFEREARNLGFRLARRVVNACGRPDEDRGDQPEFGRLDHTLDRDLIAWMRNRCRYRRQSPRRLHEPGVAFMRPASLGFHIPLIPEPIHAAFSRPTSGGGPANIASMRSSLRR